MMLWCVCMDELYDTEYVNAAYSRVLVGISWPRSILQFYPDRAGCIGKSPLA